MKLKTLLWLSAGTFVISGIIFFVTLGLQGFQELQEQFSWPQLQNSLAELLTNPIVLIAMTALVLITITIALARFPEGQNLKRNKTNIKG